MENELNAPEQPNFMGQTTENQTLKKTWDEVAADKINKLNDGQTLAFERLLDAANGRTEKRCFFLTGDGGTGNIRSLYVYNNM